MLALKRIFATLQFVVVLPPPCSATSQMRVLDSSLIREGYDYLPTPLHVFFFNDNLLDDIGEGHLQVEGNGTVNGTKYIFGNNEGPTLIGPLVSNPGDYTIELAVTLNEPFADGAGTIKLVDFGGLESDSGIYSKDGRLDYYNTDGSDSLNSVLSQFLPGVPTHVIITRRSDTGMLSLYANGCYICSVTDEDGEFEIHSSGIRFLQDDNDPFCTLWLEKEPRCDSGSGSIDYIKVYNEPLTSDDIAVLYIWGEYGPTVHICQCDLGGSCMSQPVTNRNALSVCIRVEGDHFLFSDVEFVRYANAQGDLIAIRKGKEKQTTNVVNRLDSLIITTILPEVFFQPGLNSSITIDGVVLLTLKEGLQPTRYIKARSLREQQRRQLQAHHVKVLKPFRMNFEKVQSLDTPLPIPNFNQIPVMRPTTATMKPIDSSQMKPRIDLGDVVIIFMVAFTAIVLACIFTCCKCVQCIKSGMTTFRSGTMRDPVCLGVSATD